MTSTSSSGPQASAPSLTWRLCVALAAGVLSTAIVLVLYAAQAGNNVVSDWDATWVGARALLHGQSPYAAIRMPPWPWHLNYPLPAILLSIPLTAVPIELARGLFVGLGTGIFTFVVTRRYRWPLYFLLSGAMLWCWLPVQWAPLLVAAALAPALSWLLVVKPTMGFALWAAFPRRTAVIGGLLLLAVSFLLWPTWVTEWLAAVTGTPHRPHLLRPGGFLLLLGLLRWRRPEGRLLAALAIIPQTTTLYEALPLLLVVKDRRQAAAFATLTMIAQVLYLIGPHGPWPVGATYQWWVMFGLLYLPALVLTLRRENVAVREPAF